MSFGGRVHVYIHLGVKIYTIGARGVAQAVKLLPSKCEALGVNPVPQKKKKKKKKKKAKTIEKPTTK
jgi:hypothetical protein